MNFESNSVYFQNYYKNYDYKNYKNSFTGDTINEIIGHYHICFVNVF